MSKLTSVLYNIVEQWSQEQIQQMQSILRDSGKIATGYLVSNIIYRANTNTENVNVGIEVPEYGKYVDEGRLPGKFPPVDAIEDWCRIKGIPENAAFLIARSIAENGIPPTPFMDVPFNNIDKLVNDLSEKVTEELTIELTESLKQK